MGFWGECKGKVRYSGTLFWNREELFLSEVECPKKGEHMEFNPVLFDELDMSEMREVDGGEALEAGVVLVTTAAALVGGFKAGRQFVRDIKSKLFS